MSQENYPLEVSPESPAATHPVDDLDGVAALGEPIRRRLYEVVVAAPHATGREEAARLAGVPVHTAKFHLDRLVEEGLLEVEFRRLTGRTGPGSGRPAKLYRRADREIAVTLPPRQYDLLSRILARAVVTATATGAPVAEVAAEISRGEGAQAAAAAATEEQGSSLDRLGRALAPVGYEPHLVDGRLELANCPFHRVAQEQTALVCGLNLSYVNGVCDGLGCRDLTPRLDPGSGRCCVTVTAGASESSVD